MAESFDQMAYPESFDYVQAIKNTFATDELHCKPAIDSALRNLSREGLQALLCELASDEEFIYQLCENIKVKRNPIVTCTIISGLCREHSTLISYRKCQRKAFSKHKNYCKRMGALRS